MSNSSNPLSARLSTLRRTLAVATTRVVLLGALAAVGCAPGAEDGIMAPARLSRGGPVPPAPPSSQSVSAPAGVLLACPTTREARAYALIGPAGGWVEARGARLTVPSGAVLLPTLFEVVVPVSATMTVDIRAVGLSGFQFRTPATITLSFARCGPTVSAEQLQGAFVDVTTGAILDYMGGVVDGPAKKLSFTTSHLSGYAIAY